MAEAEVDRCYEDSEEDAGGAQGRHHEQKDGVGEEVVEVRCHEQEAGEGEGGEEGEETGVPELVWV